MRAASIGCARRPLSRTHLVRGSPALPVLSASLAHAIRQASSLARTTAPAPPSVPFLTPLSESSPAGASSDGRYVIYTGYAAPAQSATPGSGASSSGAPTAIPAPAYTVTDAKAFEAALAEAVHASVQEVSIPDTTAHKKDGSRAAEVDADLPAERLAVVVHTALSRQWMASYRQDKARLQKMMDKKAPIDRYVDRLFYPALKYGCFALLGLQLGVYFNWIFFVFDWNLMEPTTYFLGYSAVYCSLVYHYVRCGHDDFTWRNLFKYWADKERVKMCEKAKIDLVDLATLQQRVQALEDEIAMYELKEE